jgi:murein DD-endopeptidase MepM/ murein hydrolase activator NlpD
LRSIVNDVAAHEAPALLDTDLVVAFPLGGAGPYLCSQSAFGKFTHFYKNTLHAVDLECPVGTPVLAVADAHVMHVQVYLKRALIEPEKSLNRAFVGP